MDFAKVYLPLVNRALVESKKAHSAVKEDLLRRRAEKTLTSKDLDKAATVISASVRGVIEDAKDGVAQRVVKALRKEAKGDVLRAADSAAAMLKGDMFSDKSAVKIQQEQRRALRFKNKADIIGMNFDTAINRLTDTTGIAGLSLFRQNRRLVLAEINRYAQRLAMLTLRELGYKKFGWQLSSQHYTVMARYGLKNEICESRSRKTYTFSRLWKLMPPHPCCMCSPTGIE